MFRSHLHQINYHSKTNTLIWMTLAFQAGVINVGGFLACQKFVSHVTGYATDFGYQLTYSGFSKELSILAVPVFFLLGCMVSAQMIDIQLKLGKRPIYQAPLMIILTCLLAITLLGAAGFFGNFGESIGSKTNYFLLGLLCFVCGLQNAMVTSVSKAVIRTTHLTGLTTDLGIGIVRLLNKNRLPQEFETEKEANLMRFNIIVSFVLGSCLGSLTFGRMGFHGFLFPSLTCIGLILIMLYTSQDKYAPGGEKV